jgi:hypothetical protein
MLHRLASNVSTEIPILHHDPSDVIGGGHQVSGVNGVPQGLGGSDRQLTDLMCAGSSEHFGPRTGWRRSEIATAGFVDWLP